jgi:hypothetical protein
MQQKTTVMKNKKAVPPAQPPNSLQKYNAQFRKHHKITYKQTEAYSISISGLPVIKRLNQLTDYYESWHRWHATGGHYC